LPHCSEYFSGDRLSLFCHFTVMKLIYAIAAAGVASLLPSALADEPANTAKPFTISISSDASPVSHAEYRYPSYAGVRGLEGACDVTFTISTAGEADGIRVGACTSGVFRAAARKAVKGMSFAPRAVATMGVRATVRWAMPSEAGVRTASLD
jgi:TonB family protein